MRGTRLAAGVVVGFLACCGIGAGDSGAKDAALKRISKATKQTRGAVADVEYSEVIGKQSVTGSGKLYIHYSGFLRVEIEGDEPRTILLARPYLFIHKHAEEVVEVYNLTSNAHRLGQYLLLGFVPTGRALKEDFNVQLAGNSVLDDKPVLSFLLTPKPKKLPAAAEAIGRIQLWVDPETGLPAQHQIVHAQGLADLNVRYLNITVDNELPDSLFRAEWPEGTTTVRK